MHRQTHLRKLLAGALLALAALAPTAAHAVNFGPATNFADRKLPQDVAVGEFNGDSDPDLAVVNQPSNNVSVLLGGAGGSFSARPTSPSASRRCRWWATSTATPTRTSRS